MTIPLITHTIDQTISTAPEFPQRSAPTTFDALADPAMAYIESMDTEYNAYKTDMNEVRTDINTTVTAMNTAVTNVESYKDAALSAANFKGDWADLTGALTVPSSVYHDSSYWLLLSDLADVTAKEPGVDSEWQLLSELRVDEDNYLIDVQNIPDMLAGRGPGYWFDGVDDVITIADDANLNLGTGDWSIISSLYNTKVAAIYEWQTGGNGIILQSNVSGFLTGGIYVSGTYVSVTANKTDIRNKNHTIALTIDRDSATGLKFYVDGSEETYSTQTNPASHTGDISGSATRYIGLDYDGVSVPYGGCIFTNLQFNLTLTPEEVKAFSSGAPIPYKYIGASQTTKFSDATSNDFTSGDTYKSWDNTTAIVSTGKQVRVGYEVTVNTSNATSLSMKYDGYGPGGITRANVDDLSVAVGVHSFETKADYDSGTGNLINFVAEGLTSGTLTVANISVTQIGCVLDLSPDGITDTTWYDKSGNDLHGTVSGALPINKQAVATDGTDGFVDGVLNLTGGQIAFPATAVPSSDPNTLDDYEEGTWTPVCARYTGGAISATYEIQYGEYIKIGNLVTVMCSIKMTGVTSQGSSLTQITGLPFTASASPCSGIVSWNDAITALVITTVMTDNSDYLLFRISNNGGSADTPTKWAQADWKIGELKFSITYSV